MSSPALDMLKHAGLALLALGTHAVIGAAAITTSWALETYILWLHNGHQPMLFGRLPLIWILEGGDAALVIGILFFGTLAAFKTLRSH